jgi:hypothetical protein
MAARALWHHRGAAAATVKANAHRQKEKPMTPLVWANFPLALMFLLAWSGIPLWMVIKHSDTAPDFSEAHAYLAAKAARAVAEPEPARAAA